NDALGEFGTNGHPRHILYEETTFGINDIVLSGKEDHERRSSTYKKGVYVDGKTLDETLLYRMCDFSGSSSMWCGSQSGLIGVDSALHAPLSGKSENP